MTALLALDEAVKSHAGKELLNVGPLALGKGDLIVLSGDNGSGKTTLLKMLAGLEPSDRLRMRFDGFEAPDDRLRPPAPVPLQYVDRGQHPLRPADARHDSAGARAAHR
jgi:ABC-type multidrug transport system ATPase subunit